MGEQKKCATEGAGHCKKERTLSRRDLERARMLSRKPRQEGSPIKLQ